MCSSSTFLPHGRKGGLGMKMELLLLSPDTVALASQTSEVFFVGAEPDGPREHP